MSQYRGKRQVLLIAAINLRLTYNTDNFLKTRGIPTTGHVTCTFLYSAVFKVIFYEWWYYQEPHVLDEQSHVQMTALGAPSL